MKRSTKQPEARSGELRDAGADDAATHRLTQQRSDGSEGALPLVLDLTRAAAMLGLGRTTAYRLVAEQQWPTPVLRLGRLIKIPTQPLLELLHGAWPPVGDAEQSASAAASGGPVLRRG